MTNSRKLLIVDSYARPNLEIPSRWFDSLPLVLSIPGEDDEPGLIEMADGGLRKILKMNGFSMALTSKDCDEIGAVFEQVINTLNENTAFQFLVTNKPLDPEKCMSAYDKICAKDDEYLAWYADYTRKWFLRVCEVHEIPNKEFYLVISADPTKNKSAAGKKQQLAELNRLTHRVMNVLNEAMLNPEILTRGRVRQHLYSCLRPSYPSGLREAPAETLTKSSLPQVSGRAFRQHVVIDGAKVASLAVSDLPSTTTMGWLMNLVTLTFDSSLSIHLRRSNSAIMSKKIASASQNLRKKFQKVNAENHSLVEMSCYFTTSAADGSTKTLDNQIAAAKKILNSHNALIVADCDQFSAWTSGMPLGINSGGTAFTISSRDASMFCPLFTAACGSRSGFPLGFAMSSREPVFLEPSQTPNIFALASSERDKQTFQTLLALRLVPTNFHILHVGEETSHLAVLREALGATLVNNYEPSDVVVNFDPTSSSKSATEPTLIDDAVLSSIILKKTFDATALRSFKNETLKWTEHYRAGKRHLAIFIDELAVFGKSKHGLDALNFIFEVAQRHGITVLTTALTSKVKEHPDVCEIAHKFSETKLVLPLGSKEQKSVARLMHLKRTDVAAVDSMLSLEPEYGMNCYLQTAENRGIVRLTLSPMDYWICPPHINDRLKKFSDMRDEVKRKNPKLSTTDATRQAVYYLGINTPTK